MVPLRRRLTVAACLVALALPRVASAQDFDPRGRQKPPPTRPTPPRPPQGTGTKGSLPPEGSAQGALLERYTKVVLAQPGSPFPLQRLAQLYRDRDGNLTALISDFQKRAA